MLNGFKQFILRGNVIDLAVGVVIGAAFGTVVNSLVKDLLTPLIAAIIRQPDFSAISFTVNSSKFMIGDLVNSVISFLIVAIAVYFFVVLPVNALMNRFRKPAETTTKQCPECKTDIPLDARRCPHCTSILGYQK